MVLNGLLTGLLTGLLRVCDLKGLSEKPLELNWLSCKVDPEFLNPFELLFFIVAEEELEVENRRLNSLKVTLESLSISSLLNVLLTSSSVV